jgi:shikimate kinase
MGSGKTKLGKELAEKLSCKFIDLDEEIMCETRYMITDFFDEFGEAAFREKEREILLKLVIGNSKGTILSTGGGTPCYKDNMEIMNKAGVTVFLDVPVETILERVKHHIQSRPMLKNVPAEKLPEFIRRHLESRMKFYSRAKIIIKGEHSMIDVISKISEISNIA